MYGSNRTVCKLFVLDMNTCYYLTMLKIIFDVAAGLGGGVGVGGAEAGGKIFIRNLLISPWN